MYALIFGEYTDSFDDVVIIVAKTDEDFKRCLLQHTNDKLLEKIYWIMSECDNFVHLHTKEFHDIIVKNNKSIDQMEFFDNRHNINYSGCKEYLKKISAKEIVEFKSSVDGEDYGTPIFRIQRMFGETYICPREDKYSKDDLEERIEYVRQEI